jgi:hypothetical protein
MTKQIFIAYTLLDIGNNQHDRRTRIGVAWPHPDDDGLTVELDALPLDGRFILVPQDQTDRRP